MSEHVWVEADLSGVYPRVVRIFKSDRSAFAAHIPLTSMHYMAALASVRRQCFYRSKGFCELCGDLLTEKSGHLHERKHRGKGGEISLENSVFVCAKTHKREHRDREPKFTRRQS